MVGNLHTDTTGPTQCNRLLRVIRSRNQEAWLNTKLTQELPHLAWLQRRKCNQIKTCLKQESRWLRKIRAPTFWRVKLIRHGTTWRCQAIWRLLVCLKWCTRCLVKTKWSKSLDLSTCPSFCWISNFNCVDLPLSQTPIDSKLQETSFRRPSPVFFTFATSETSSLFYKTTWNKWKLFWLCRVYMKASVVR